MLFSLYASFTTYNITTPPEWQGLRNYERLFQDPFFYTSLGNTLWQGSPNWINTFLPLIVPAFAGNAFFIFLMRQQMRGIPIELSEAARIDGASELQIWWRIIVPLVRPVMAVVAIFTFQATWEDFMGPLLYLQSEEKYTLQLDLRQFEAAAGGLPAWNELMAASLVVMLPVLVLFLAFQRSFIEDIQIGGSLKG